MECRVEVELSVPENVLEVDEDEVKLWRFHKSTK